MMIQHHIHWHPIITIDHTWYPSIDDQRSDRLFEANLAKEPPMLIFKSSLISFEVSLRWCPLTLYEEHSSNPLIIIGTHITYR